jgi:hypothetical protein
MPKRLEPLNAMKVEKIKPAETLIDGDVPGLRVRKTAGGLSWGLSVRVKGARRWIAVGVGIGLAETRQRARKLRQAIADGRDLRKSVLRRSSASRTLERGWERSRPSWSSGPR